MKQLLFLFAIIFIVLPPGKIHANTELLNSDFIGTSNIELSQYDSNWVKINAYGTNYNAFINNNSLYANSNQYPSYRWEGNYPSQNYKLCVDADLPQGNGFLVLGVRQSGDWEDNLNQFQIIEKPPTYPTAYYDYYQYSQSAGNSQLLWNISRDTNDVGRHTWCAAIKDQEFQVSRDNVLYNTATAPYNTTGFAGIYFTPNVKIYNITITELNDGLDVPLIMQVGQSWSGYQYDHSDEWVEYANSTIADSGCAITSTAMILQYYGINVLPDGSPLDPGSLNEWLINNDGYKRNGSIIWNAISDISSVEKYPSIKEYNPSYEHDGLTLDENWAADEQRIINDLNEKIPVILRVNNNKHFVLATGYEDNAFIINDPLFNTPKKLTDNYNGIYQSIRRYIPSHTDLSYIVIAVEDDVIINVKDNLQNEIGVQNIEQPVTITGNGTEFANYPLKTVYIKQPASGKYTISLTSLQNDTYLADIYAYDKKSKIKKESFHGKLNPNTSEIITINFDKEDAENTVVIKDVTFQSTIDDVKGAIEGKTINKGIGTAIIKQLQHAQKEVKKNKKFAVKLRLALIEKLLKTIGKKHGLITKEAYTILAYDIGELQKSLK